MEVFGVFSNRLTEMEEKQEKSYESLVDDLKMMSEKMNSQDTELQCIKLRFEIISEKVNLKHSEIHSVSNKLNSIGKRVTKLEHSEPVIIQVIFQ